MLLRPDLYEDLHLNINYARRRVEVDGAPVALTRKEYELLALLARNAGEIVRRDTLLRQVWGYGEGVRTRTLDVHIRRVRKKLSPFSEQYIETIFGVGYRFQPFRPRSSLVSPRSMVLPATA
jgi:DNA-binding response OmpR family regulator